MLSGEGTVVNSPKPFLNIIFLLFFFILFTIQLGISNR